MKQIASFTIDHDLLEKGMYVSRIDGDVITYDIRMKKPNQGDYLSNGALHTFEHLFATYARNSRYSQDVVYVGPMGCRTGFYFLLRDTVSNRRHWSWCGRASALLWTLKERSPAASAGSAAIIWSMICRARRQLLRTCWKF